MIYGYEDYEIQCLNSYYFYPVFKSSTDYLVGPNVLSRYNNSLRFSTPTLDSLISKNSFLFYIDSSNDNKLIEPYLYTPKEGESLFYIKQCKIPRLKCADKFKRVIKLEKADCVVVPNKREINIIKDVVIFINKDIKLLTIIYGIKKENIPLVGDTFEFFHNKFSFHQDPLSNEKNKRVYDIIKNSKCLYTGNLFSADDYIFDIVEGKYPKIVDERVLLESVSSSEDQALTSEILEEIETLITSSDAASVHQGLRILAELNYVNHKPTVSYLLRKTRNNWSNYRPFNSSVQFMLKTLEATMDKYYIFKDITKEEFNTFEKYYYKLIQNQILADIALYKQKFNLVIDAKLDLKVSHPGD